MAPSWVFLCCHVLPVHLSRKLFSDSAGGETFSGRQRPFAGGLKVAASYRTANCSRGPKAPGTFRRDGYVRAIGYVV
jgi:hypothetical protein